jgi:hypothetical protein
MEMLFTFFVQNVDHRTSRLWTLWLRDHVFYSPHFPVSPRTVSEAAVKDHLVRIGVLFTEFLLSGENFANKRLELYLDSWSVLCENERLCLHVCQQLIRDLHSGRQLFRGNAVQGWIHPIISRIGDDALKRLVDGILRYLPMDECLEKFVEFAVCVAVICGNRFEGGDLVLRKICEALLDWIEKLYARGSIGLEFVIDGYNYIIAKDRLGENKISCARLPVEIRNFVLSNTPPAAGVEVENTVFMDPMIPSYERRETPEDDAGAFASVNEENPFGEEIGGYAAYDGEDFWSFE